MRAAGVLPKSSPSSSGRELEGGGLTLTPTLSHRGRGSFWATPVLFTNTERAQCTEAVCWQFKALRDTRMVYLLKLLQKLRGRSPTFSQVFHQLR